MQPRKNENNEQHGQKNRKTCTITLDNQDYLILKNEMASLSGVKELLDRTLSSIQNDMANELYLSKNAKKGVGLIPEKTVPNNEDGYWAPYPCMCGRQKYCVCPRQIYIPSSINPVIIPAHYASYVPDEDARNDARKKHESLEKEYLFCDYRLKQNQAKIGELKTKILEIEKLDVKNISLHIDSFKDSTNLDFTHIKIKSLNSLLGFLGNKHRLENAHIDFDILLNGLNDDDAIFLANALSSLDRIRSARFNIHLENTAIGHKGGNAILEVLKSANRPVWLTIYGYRNTFFTWNPHSYSLLSAIKAEDVETVASLLIEGQGNGNQWDCDHLGDSPLHWAARQGNQDIVGLLMDNGFSLGKQNKFGLTPIERCEGKNLFKLEKYIAEKASTDEQDTFHYGTVLLHAIKEKDLAAMRILLKRGAGNKKNHTIKGDFALHLALAGSNPDPVIVQILIDHNFPLDEKNSFGVTPAQMIARLAYGRNSFGEVVLHDKNSIDAFKLIYAKYLFGKHNISADAKEKSEIIKEINKLYSDLKNTPGRNTNKNLYYEIANFYFFMPEKGNEQNILAIIFFTLSAASYGDKIDVNNIDEASIKECKIMSYLALLDCKIDLASLGLDFTQLSLKNIKEYMGAEKFSGTIKSSGLIEKLHRYSFGLHAGYNHPCINFELAELYFFLNDHKNLYDCMIMDPDNKEISALVFSALTSINGDGMDGYLDELNKQKQDSFWYRTVYENRARTYKILLNDSEKSLLEKNLILLAIFSNTKGSDLKRQFAQTLGFENANDAREHFIRVIRLIKKKQGLTFNTQALNEAMGEIVSIANADQVFSKEELDQKFASIMQVFAPTRQGLKI